MSLAITFNIHLLGHAAEEDWSGASVDVHPIAYLGSLLQKADGLA
jgi:hypothetical protein